jgi:hypothetical protein
MIELDQPFISQHLEEEKDYKKQDVISLKLNEKERQQLEEDKVALQQEKDATAMKQMWKIGRKVIHGTPEGRFLKLALENMKKNKRLGIAEVEAKPQQK